MDETAPFEVRLAYEWWQAGGEQTEVRLLDLIRHYCGVYGQDEAYLDTAIEHGKQLLRSDGVSRRGE